jgi:hypothetical protein
MFSCTEEEWLSYLQHSQCLQASAMDKAPNPLVPDLFKNKIPASFMGSHA